MPDNIGAGNCLDFDGVDDFVENIGTTASYSFIQNTGVFTIEAWVQYDEVNIAQGYAITSTSSTGQWIGFSFGFLGEPEIGNYGFSAREAEEQVLLLVIQLTMELITRLLHIALVMLLMIIIGIM